MRSDKDWREQDLKRRTWRKRPLGVDPESGEIQAAALTENSISDDAMAETLLQQSESIIKYRMKMSTLNPW